MNDTDRPPGSLSRCAPLVLLALLLSLSADPGCSVPPPVGDLALTNARIRTLSLAQRWAEVLVLQEGVIVYVGDEDGADLFIDDDTPVLDAGGRLVLPGLHDVHQHTLEAHLPVIDCLLDPGVWDPEDYIAVVAQCDVAPGTDWVLGWGHSILTLLEAERDPRRILDDAIADRPVAIMELTSHSTWVNTRALQVLGLDADSADPQGGLILRGEGGFPDGLLIDSAGELPWDLALQPNPELDALNIEALRDGLAHNNEMGITSAVDARTYWQRGYLDAYEALQVAGDLSVRMVLSLWASPTAEDDAQIAALQGLFRDRGDRLRVRQVKLYSDGLLENTTAALLAPYTTLETFGAPRGLNYFPAARLNRYVSELAETGFDAHIHAIGDRAVREALDAVALANPAEHHHRLTHVELLSAEDLPRFAALGVAVDLQLGPHNMPSSLHDLDELVGAARVNDEAWRLRDLWDSGALLALSSDYDVGDLSPFAGMQRALTRGAQSLPDVEAAVLAYTRNAAQIMGSLGWTGSLEVGKVGDFVVLDQDIFAVPSEEIGATRVLLTAVGGQVVYVDRTVFPDAN